MYIIIKIQNIYYYLLNNILHNKNPQSEKTSFSKQSFAKKKNDEQSQDLDEKSVRLGKKWNQDLVWLSSRKFFILF